MSNDSGKALLIYYQGSGLLRHYARRAFTTGEIEILDREFDFVRVVLPYDYRWTCNAQQWDEAERICRVLEESMVSLGVT
jgi:hypothetical protein